MVTGRTLLRATRARLAATSRTRAFVLHLALSASVVGVFCAVLRIFWYPGPWFTASGAGEVLSVLIGVDVVLGPVLTLIVFKPAKPSLPFDLAAIAIVQIAALVYGSHTIYAERPYYAVFAVDRYEVLARGDAVLDDEKAVALPPKPWRGPLHVVALRPEDPLAYQRLLEETLFKGLPDIDRRPEFWAPLEDHVATISARAESLEDFAARRPDAAAAMARLEQSRHGRAMGLLPGVSRGRRFTTLVIDLETGRPREALALDYWRAESADAQ